MVNASNNYELIETRRLMRAIFICFFASGAAGLIYEILWIRMLGLVFGHTVHAITTVLVAFMAGLALGSYLCGRVADRIQNLLRLYGLLEIGIGVYCLLTPYLVELIKLVYLWLARSFELPFTIFTLVQFLLASLALLLPTTLMGATLPILSRFFVSDIGEVGQRVGTLYAFNTFGAVFGTYLAGFQLLPVMGMQLTLFFAATLNIGIGVLILLFDRRLTPPLTLSPDSIPEVVAKTPRPFPTSWDFQGWLLVIGFALSGAASMIYEIAWTRALSLIIGSSTYAFSAMLLSFLIGIAAGSAFFARFTKKASVSHTWFWGLQLAIGISVVVIFPLFDLLPEVFLSAFRMSRVYSFILVLQIVISFAVMILPTLFIGATFPCIVQILSKDLTRIGFDVGHVYAFNTAGAILGSFAAGFILIPLVGVQTAIKIAILINLLMGLSFFLFSDQKIFLRVATGSGMVVAMLGVILLPAWDQKVMSSGVSVYAPIYLRDLAKAPFRDRLSEEKILFYRDGISSTITVHELKEVTFLRVNGKTDASTGVDMHTQLMLGHLPALLHPDPKTALVIGLGSGVTVGALTQYNLERIDVVEIEPAVIKASFFFEKENQDALSDPRVRVIVADGRNFLLTTSQQYDLIISEPSSPWMGGVATLFTIEFFDLARKHLNSDGIMVQWFHGYVMAPGDVQMVAATFRSIFPHATLWTTIKEDYLLIGAVQPLVVDLDRIHGMYKNSLSLRQDMERFKMLSPEAILSDFYLDENDLDRLTMGAELNTDDRLPLEFSAPRSLYRDTVGINEMTLRRVKQSRYPTLHSIHLEDLDRPEHHYHLAISFINKRMTSEAMEHLEAALAKNPRYTPALLESGRHKMRENRILEAMDHFQTVLAVDPKSAEAHHELGLLYLSQNKVDQGIQSMKRAITLEPKKSQYPLDLADAYRQNKQYEKAIEMYRLALKLEPQNHRIMGALGATLVLLDRTTDAIEVLNRAITLDPKDHRLHYQLGQAYLHLEQDHEARKAFENAAALNPLDPEPYVGLGKVWLSLGDRSKAMGYFKKATRINPLIPIPEV